MVMLQGGKDKFMSDTNDETIRLSLHFEVPKDLGMKPHIRDKLRQEKEEFQDFLDIEDLTEEEFVAIIPLFIYMQNLVAFENQEKISDYFKKYGLIEYEDQEPHKEGVEKTKTFRISFEGFNPATIKDMRGN